MSEESKAITVTQAPTTANFLEVIASAARDPNIDVSKMQGILDIQERMMNKQAEIIFNQQFTKMQAELPRITMDAKIKHGDKVISSYATYEHIDETIRPLLVKYGFSLRFNSRRNGADLTIMGTLAHVDGHSIQDEIGLSPDAGGAKNNVQAVGSTISYGQRYLAKMMLNLVFEGEDDDGGKSGYSPISDSHAAELKELIQSTGADTKKFLEYIGAKSVDEMDARDYGKAKMALQQKAKAATK